MHSVVLDAIYHHVSAQVDTEDGDGAQGQRDVDYDEEQEGGDLRDVAGQGVRNGLLQIVKDQSTCKKTNVFTFPVRQGSLNLLPVSYRPEDYISNPIQRSYPLPLR